MTDENKPKSRRRTKSYPGSLARRGDSWRIRLCVGGKYHSFTVEGDKVAAQNFAKTKHAELSGDLQRTKQGLPGPITFSALCDEFTKYELPALRADNTRKSYKGSVSAFRAYFVDELKDPMVRDIRRSKIQTFLEWRRSYNTKPDEPVSGHTVARDWRVLRRLFHYAMSKDYLDANPCRFARVPNVETRNPPILTPEQLDALMEEAKSTPMLATYILLLADTGMRAESEALALRWTDLDLAGAFITVKSDAAEARRTKSGKTRVVPMTSRLKAALQQHAAQYRLGVGSPYVFAHVVTRRTAKKGQPVTSFRDAIERAAAAAKLPEGFRPHDLRHRRVTTWLSEGKSPVLVQSAMGHAAISTTMGYSHLQAEHLRPLVEEPAETSAKAARS
jgi:integrase